MLIIYKFQGFHAMSRGAYPPKNARKDTTIFFFFFNFIEKLTQVKQKKLFSSCQKRKKDGKKIGFLHF